MRSARPNQTFLITPRVGRVGTEVALSASGMPSNTELVVGFGAPRGGHQLIGPVRTDGEGAFEFTAEVPSWAEPNEAHYFFLNLPDQPPFATSGAFHVTRPDGSFSVVGEVTGRTSGAALLRGGFGDLYCLSGEVDGLESGTRFSVEGVVGEASACSEDAVPMRLTSINPR